MPTSSPRPLTTGSPTGPDPPFPLRLSGKIIKGFGRGSSDLGIPTANIPIEGLSVGGHEDVESGVYYGFAGISDCEATRGNKLGSARGEYGLMKTEIYEELIEAIEEHRKGSGDAEGDDKGQVYPMVMSIGWNPYYKNSVRSVEVHIMQHFATQFYGAHMNLVVLGFIRPELDYVSMEALVEDIKTDIDVAGRSLAREGYVCYFGEGGLRVWEGRGDVGS